MGRLFSFFAAAFAFAVAAVRRFFLDPRLRPARLTAAVVAAWLVLAALGAAFDAGRPPPRFPHLREAAGLVFVFLGGLALRPVLARTGKFWYLLKVLDYPFRDWGATIAALRRDNKRLRRRAARQHRRPQPQPQLQQPAARQHARGGRLAEHANGR